MLSHIVAARDQINDPNLSGVKGSVHKGLVNGNKATVLDAANIIRECWDKLDHKIIAACWVRARCLPLCDLEDVASSSREYSKVLASETVEEIFYLLEGKWKLLFCIHSL